MCFFLTFFIPPACLLFRYFYYIILVHFFSIYPTVYFELDRGNVFKEAYADGTAVQKYLWGAGLVGNGKGEFYLKNGHGDVVQIVNSSFEVKDNYAYEYDAFGNNINKRNGDTNPFRYCSDNR